ncbi:unnamed protein product [Prunus armeniaca]|uniref:HMA domain-containing protein n=1 Tax=Prunus armeniaca TaxID=36596 RepID=A0A6J5VIL8_PRUAR|nr:unnamed protein product [Prunus armeniaca]
MVQKTVLKVDISCLKCKKKLIKAVSGLKGVDKVEADAAKGTLTVTGDCDPYEIIVRTRKVGKCVEVVSIGPPPPPPKQPPPKKEKEKPDPRPQHICMPHDYVIVGACNEPNPSCSIM